MANRFNSSDCTPKSRNSRVLTSTLSNYGGEIVRTGIGFGLTPIILHYLGPAQFGLWILAGAVTGYGSLLDFGISSAVVKYVAEYNARRDLPGARAMVATALCLYLLLAAITAALSAAIAPHFPAWFHLPPQEHARTTRLVLLMGLGAAVTIPCGITAAVLSGLHRFDVVNLLGTANAVCSAIATICVLWLGGGLLGMVAAGIAVNLLMQLPAVWCVRRLAPVLGVRGATLRLFRTVVSFSSSMFVMDFSGRLLTRTDELVIAAFLPVEAITPYALARRLGEVPQMLAEQYTRVLLPLASESHAARRTATVRSIFVSGTGVTLAISLVAGCPLLLLAGPVLRAWVGASYVPYAYLVVLLAISNLIDVWQWPGGVVLQGMGRHRPLALISLASSLVSVALSIVLAPRLGLAGVALGTLLPTAAAAFVTVPYALRTIGVPAADVLSTCRPAIVAVIPAALLCGLLSRTALSSSTPGVIALGAATSLVCAGLSYVGIVRRSRRPGEPVLVGKGSH